MGDDFKGFEKFDRFDKECRPDIKDDEWGFGDWLPIIIIVFLLCGGTNIFGGGYGGYKDDCYDNNGLFGGGSSWLLILVVIFLFLGGDHKDGKGFLGGLFG